MDYTKQAKEVISYSKRIAKKLGYNYIGTEHLLIALIHSDGTLASKALKNLGVTEESVTALIKELISPVSSEVLTLDYNGPTPKYDSVIEASEAEAKLSQMEEIGTEHLLLAMIKNVECAGTRILTSLAVDLQKLYTEILNFMGKDAIPYREMTAANRKNSASGSSTSTLDKYSRDLSKLARSGQLDPIVGREEEINRIIQILSRRGKNNPCLIGEPGVGKTAIVEGLAARIESGMVPKSVAGKRVINLDLSGMVAGTKYRGEFEERIKKTIDEIIASGNVLLFVDELHTLIGAGGAEGALDASNILKPALARGEIQLIGATTITEYRKYIEKDAALERRFQPVNVEEPTIDETKKILFGIRHLYESHHGIEISDEAINACVDLSERYIQDRFLPDKAIDLLDEAAASISLNVDSSALGKANELLEIEREISDTTILIEDSLMNEELSLAREYKEKLDELEKKAEDIKKKSQRKSRAGRVLKENDIANVVAVWTKIPVSKISEKESTRLKKMEKILHKRVIGQDEAISAVSRSIRRGRVGLKEADRPIGSFLFLGPTGVGKTEVSKAVAEAVFGDEKSLIRVDMTEYMEKHSVSKMIGSPPGYVGFDDGGQLSEKVRRNPYSVILFDEIEKAHPDVFNILLQVLDDGRITDSQGRTVSFNNTVIIMTSNAGASSIVEPQRLGFSSGDDEAADYERMKSGVMEELKRIFKPEFLNRIDETIVFRMLTKPDMKQIVGLLTNQLHDRIYERFEIDLVIRDSVKTKIVEDAYDAKFGARPLKRKIQNLLEDRLADEILSNDYGSGDTIVISVKKNEIIFEKSKKEK